MTRFSYITFVTLVLGLSAVPGAQAATAPFWSIGGTRLTAGRTHNIDARALPGGAGFTLSVPALGLSLTCTRFQFEKGVLVGSNEGQAGKGQEIALLSNCILEGNGVGCKVPEPIKTEPLASELVEVVKGKQLLQEFRPVSGSTVMSLAFEPGCTFEELNVTGEIAAELLTDPGKERIELGQTAKEATSWLVNFPATTISEVLLVNNTKGTVEVAKLKTWESFLGPMAIEGSALVLLANTKFESERNAKWSPLP